MIKWGLDRKISVAVLISVGITLLAHTFGAIWFAASLNERVSQMEKVINGDPPLNVDVAIMKGDIRTMKESQLRIENLLIIKSNFKKDAIFIP